MRNSVLAWLLVLVAAGAAQAATAETPSVSMAPPAARQRDLLAEAGEQHFWIARVVKESADNSMQTSITYRSQWSGNADWMPLPVISDRVVSMATSNGELLLVLANGQWEIADGTDIRTGPSDGLWDAMLAVANGQDTVWAIVRCSPASTRASAGTTNPASMPVAEETTRPDAEPRQTETESRLMVSQFSQGKWTQPQPLPEGVSNDPAQMSMGVVDEMPMLAWRTSEGRLCVSKLTAQHEWTRPVFVSVPTDPFDFKLLAIHGRGVLWVAASPPPTTRPTTQPWAGGAGEVLIGDDFSRRIALRMPATLPSNLGPQTLVSAFGNLRWIAYASDQQIEQDFSLDDFPKSFPPTAKMSAVPSAKPPVIPMMPWIGGDAIMVLLAALAALRQRKLSESDTTVDRGDAKPRLAPLGVRFVAGLVDLAPILAVVALVQPANAANPLLAMGKSLVELLWLSLTAYVLHTLVAELICGQSIGKMVFGLRVVDLKGNAPSAGAIVLRNLLRVADVTLGLPLLIVFLTPLRQRVGDLVAGTVVISREGEEEEEEQS
ncbi:MAG: RDD family protein [Tepidisphaeraceae bacterium]